MAQSVTQSTLFPDRRTTNNATTNQQPFSIFSGLGTSTTNSPVQNPAWVLQPTIELCGHTDVTLIIGEEEQPVRASVAVLRNAGPVWRAMFEPHWAESEASEIFFPEDDVEAMLLVFRIAHLRFQDLPKKNGLTFKTLLNLAVVSDKYDVVHLVRPFLDLNGWAQKYAYPNYTGPNYASWLFIAWTFGYATSFDALSRHLAFTLHVKKPFPGWTIYLTTHDFIVERDMPPDIMDSILQVRKNALAAGLKECYAILDKAIARTECVARTYSGKPKDAPECHSMIIGTLLSQMIFTELYPSRVQAQNTDWSVQYLQETIGAIKPTTYESYDFAKLHDTSRHGKNPEEFRKCGLISHALCGTLIDFAAAMRQVVSQMPSPMLDSHKRHMEEQAKK
ncbi:hypothetical protein P280DRAFT_519400 [Massarina eburnea CBS 473.64]|uniref:BTB domain-containing protein n=1 Tax=Massarina eburnea CBS 473.64 TaxID=1395130 RepID=A0A6A6RVL3_9PLEO|nr:hypothetical protein P280DRAFT_519400 [Massarina eburnea CBS 473.64]